MTQTFFDPKNSENLRDVFFVWSGGAGFGFFGGFQVFGKGGVGFR